jgi:Xaa-Pro dipeptidase
MRIEEIQQALAAEGLDGWLFFDHHRRDPLAYGILGLGAAVPSRRWYYFIRREGAPCKLVHRIESGMLDSLPGSKRCYASWEEQRAQLAAMFGGARQIAMQYSHHCAIPYVSLVDAGTVELVRAAGVEVVSSADLVQQFEARWTEEQFAMHVEAGRRVDRVRAEAFDFVRQRVRAACTVTEYEVQQFIREGFRQQDLLTDHGPIVAVSGNASDPHYEPTAERSSSIRPGDLVLMDMWAKLAKADAVYYDITWTGFCGEAVPESIQRVFASVREARKRACDFVARNISEGAGIFGYQVDDVARGYIREQGYGDYFFHRTGHSIGTEVHGNGANMDNLESHDERRILARTCFSIEPGIYLPEFGIRSEVNVYVGDGFARVTGEEQTELVRI